MICNEARNLLPSWIEGGVTGARAAALEEHLAACEACGTFAEGLRANGAFLLDRLVPIADLVRPDLAGLESAPPPKPPPKRKREPEAEGVGPRRPHLAGAIPVLVVVALGIGAFLVLPRDESPGDGAATDTARVRRPAHPRTPAPAAPAPETPEPAPARPTAPEHRPYRPVPVPPDTTQLLPNFLERPAQLTLERIWRSLAEDPGDARKVIDRLRLSESERERALLALTLAAGGAEARSALADLLTGEGSPLVRGAAAAALGHVPDGNAGEIEVMKVLHVKAGKIGDPELRGLLLAASETERDPGVLSLLIRLVAPSQADDPTITPRILELVRAPDEQVRKGALDAIRLARIHDLRVLTELIEDEELPVDSRVALVDLLPDADPAGRRAVLLRLLGSSEEEPLRLAALRGLARHPTEETLAEAIRILRSGESGAMRTAAIEAIAAHRNREALGVLEEIAAGDPDQAIRGVAKSHVDALRTALEAEEKGR